MSSMREQTRYLKADEVCEKFGITISTLYRWIDEGIPSLKVGGIRRFDPAAVDMWFRQRSAKEKA